MSRSSFSPRDVGIYIIHAMPWCSCCFGTFLYNCEAERLQSRPRYGDDQLIVGTVPELSRSLWDFIGAKVIIAVRQQFK